MGICDSTKEDNSNYKTSSGQHLDDTQQTILECKIVRDKIKQTIRASEKKANNLKLQAADYVRQGDKDRARIYLRRKNMQLQRIKASEGALDMINDQITMIESARTMKDALNVLQKGNVVLKNLQKEAGIEEWEKMADDLEELKDADREVSEFLREQGINEGQFDKEVNDEMNRLQNEISGGGINLPSVPAQDVKQKVTTNKKKVAFYA